MLFSGVYKKQLFDFELNSSKVQKYEKYTSFWRGVYLFRKDYLFSIIYCVLPPPSLEYFPKGFWVEGHIPGT